MKIAIIGANGQLGSDIYRILLENNFEVVPLTHEDIEISRLDSVESVLSKIKADIVINTAAFHNVPKCEEDPLTAFSVNAIGAKNLADTVNKIGAILIHISTDYVFDGNKKAPYVEDDLPMPLNVYGNSKLAGEYFIQASANRYYILRVSGLYGKNPCKAKGGLNFVKLMLKLAKERGEVKVVDDEILTPTYTMEVARQILELVKRGPEFGIYHATAEGSCSWYQFAKAIFEITRTKVTLKKALPGEFSSTVKRPKYSVLENKNLKKKGINVFKHWREALREYLEEEL